jgi:hypothetical protein
VVPEPGPYSFRQAFRLSVQLAYGHQELGSAVLAIVAALLRLDMRIDRISYRLVRATRHMLVDHRGPLTVVPHARHQVTQQPVRAAVPCC